MSITAEHKLILEEERRSTIMTSAKRLFYLRGFSGTSIEAIAADAGVSKGLIYHYFSNKEALLLSFYGEVSEYLVMLEHLADPYEALRQFGCDFLVNDEAKFAEAPPIQILLTTFASEEVDAAQYEKENPILRDFGRGFLGGLFQRGIEVGVFRKGDAEAYGDIYWSFLMGKLLPVKKGHESQPAETYVEEALCIFK